MHEDCKDVLGNFRHAAVAAAKDAGCQMKGSVSEELKQEARQVLKIITADNLCNDGAARALLELVIPNFFTFTASTVYAIPATASAAVKFKVKAKNQMKQLGRDALQQGLLKLADLVSEFLSDMETELERLRHIKQHERQVAAMESLRAAAPPLREAPREPHRERRFDRQGPSKQEQGEGCREWNGTVCLREAGPRGVPCFLRNTGHPPGTCTEAFALKYPNDSRSVDWMRRRRRA